MRRRAVITGAADGIGKAAAERLARAGYDLALIDRHSGRLNAVAADCRRGGMQVEAFACDITMGAQVDSLFADIATASRRIDLLVAAAGIGRYAPFLDIGPDEWAAMLDANVLGVVRSVRGVLPTMVRQGEGRIILLGSRRGLEPTAQTAAYSATKAALIGLARSLSLEVAPHGIHICLLCPGGVRTNFRSPAADKDPRFMDPADVAEAIAFMAATPVSAWVRELEILPPGL